MFVCSGLPGAKLKHLMDGRSNCFFDKLFFNVVNLREKSNEGVSCPGAGRDERTR